MLERLEKIEKESKLEIKSISSLSELELFRIKYLGKKGVLTLILKEISLLSQDERPKLGKIANTIRGFLEENITSLKEKFEEENINKKLAEEKIDITAPGIKNSLGKKHPLNVVLEEIEDIFISMGFSIEEGPEIEYVKYNFDDLNSPPNHPSRDLTDTFYVNDKLVLRTQTSPVQIRTMKNKKPPIRMIAPGRVYRRDEVDATHSPIFHQIEGLVVDTDITMANLKGTIEVFLQKLYGNNTKLKFRPHNFPFTEPSAEVDISCFKCGGSGCSFCKNEGWIEILGCGMVHQNVFKNCEIDPEVYSGFAFGLGLERIAMFKYGIEDIRLFYENDMRFLKQF